MLPACWNLINDPRASVVFKFNIPSVVPFIVTADDEMRSFSFAPIPNRICFPDSALNPRSVELPVLKSDIALPIYAKVVQVF